MERLPFPKPSSAGKQSPIAFCRETLRRLIPWTLALGVLFFLWYFDRFRLRDLTELKITWSWAVAALVLFLPNYFVAALRFQIVLSSMQSRPTFRQAWTWTLDAALGDLVLPVVVGGDIVKLAHVSHSCNRAVALASTFADRLCGLLGVFVLALAASLAAIDWLWSDSPVRPLMLTSLIVTACMVVAGVVLMVLHRPVGRLYKAVARRLPLGEKLIRVAEIFSHWVRHPGYLAMSLLYSTLGHLCWCLSALCLAKALNIPIDVRAALLVLPMVIFCNTISFAGGIGGGLLAFEYLFQHMLGAKLGDGAHVGLAMVLFVNLSKAIALLNVLHRLWNERNKQVPIPRHEHRAAA